MKQAEKIFLAVAIFVVTAFFYVQVKLNSQDIIFNAIARQVVITGTNSKEKIDSKQFEKQLSDFAIKNHSLIARRLLVPDSKTNNSYYEYQLFGRGQVPANLKKYTCSTTVGNPLSIGTDYLILSGSDTASSLSNFFNSHFEVQSFSYPKTEYWRQMLMAFGDSNTLPILIVLLLSYFCLSLFAKISELRNTGIKILSGEGVLKIAFQDFGISIIFLLCLSILAFLIDGILLYWSGLANTSIYILLGFSFWYIFLGFTLVLIVTSLLILLVLKRTHLINLVKRKLQTWQLMTLSIVVWIIISLMLAGSLGQVFSLNSNLREQQGEIISWKRYSACLNINATIQENSQDNHAWWEFYNNQVQNNTGLLVDYSNEFSPYRKTDIAQGNYLIVTPKYLQLEHITTGNDYKNLKVGTYGLILPEKLKNDTQKYIKAFNQFISGMTVGDTKSQLSMQASVSYTPNNQKYFIFNNVNSQLNPDISQQTVKDPIILVISPKATGKNSGMFWSGEYNYFYSTQGYRNLVNSLNSAGVYSEVGFIQDGYSLFREYMTQLRISVVLQLIDALMTIVLSSLFCGFIVVLYLLHFRREIAVKRLSGMSFYSIHIRFIGIGLAVVALFVLIASLVFANVLIAVVVGLVQLVLSYGILRLLVSATKRQQINVLKGE
ncbi:MAG: DUF1430 domain-containing protein [Streptococcaceae bacterium]|jgi:putative ABC transport system permease protein|nr:DUF1430 domain-containing protein [Streptococcaceae bacterium]